MNDMFGIDSISRFQRLKGNSERCPGALPQAFTFRAVGASGIDELSLRLLAILLLASLPFGSHVRKQNHVADRLLVGQ